MTRRKGKKKERTNKSPHSTKPLALHPNTNIVSLSKSMLHEIEQSKTFLIRFLFGVGKRAKKYYIYKGRKAPKGQPDAYRVYNRHLKASRKKRSIPKIHLPTPRTQPIKKVN